MNQKPGEKIFSEFEASILSEKITGSQIVDYTSMLFRNASMVFDAGSAVATSLLCRSTLETAFFLFLTGYWEEGILRIETPRFLNSRPRNVSFEELKTGITRTWRVVLDPSQVTAIERIQEHGNLIAHFGSRRINEVQRADKLLVTPGIEKARTPEDWRRAVDHFESKLKIWVTQDQALADLRDTSDILLTVFRHQKFMEGWK
jgi:hypothetical protein